MNGEARPRTRADLHPADLFIADKLNEARRALEAVAARLAGASGAAESADQVQCAIEAVQAAWMFYPGGRV